MKCTFYKLNDSVKHPWKMKPELLVADEPRIGDKHQLFKGGKLWKVADITWCFVPGSDNKFSHFDVGVV